MTMLDHVPFTLPPEAEAREPAEARGAGRDDVRLLMTGGYDGQAVHARFTQLPELLAPGDLLVLNASATLPAALDATRADGTRIALHISTHLPADLTVVEPRSTVATAGERLLLADGAHAILLTPYRSSRRLWIATLDIGSRGLIAFLQRHGKPIAYPYVNGAWPIESYQNVYATEPGSAEMPSAGRPITRALLAQLSDCGVETATLLLHTGTASPERDEPPYEEYYDVPAGTVAAVRRARAAGRRVIAVGTTAVRALESAADADGEIAASHGWTDLVISADRPVRFVDGLLTGFHEPRSTHLAMLEAIAGRAHIAHAYAAALAGGYLWHEFGDSHLMLP